MTFWHEKLFLNQDLLSALTYILYILGRVLALFALARTSFVKRVRKHHLCSQRTILLRHVFSSTNKVWTRPYVFENNNFIFASHKSYTSSLNAPFSKSFGHEMKSEIYRNEQIFEDKCKQWDIIIDAPSMRHQIMLLIRQIKWYCGKVPRWHYFYEEVLH